MLKIIFQSFEVARNLDNRHFTIHCTIHTPENSGMNISSTELSIL